MSKNISLSKGMDQFSKEVTQNENAMYTGAHETNKIMNFFSRYLISLDWDNYQKRLHSFDFFIDRDFTVNIVSPLPNNHKTLILSKETDKLYMVTRNMKKIKSEKEMVVGEM